MNFKLLLFDYFILPFLQALHRLFELLSLPLFMHRFFPLCKVAFSDYGSKLLSIGVSEDLIEVDGVPVDAIRPNYFACLLDGIDGLKRVVPNGVVAGPFSVEVYPQLTIGVVLDAGV